MADTEKLEKLAGLIRYYILISTTEAGSGHPTSSLSAVELMVGLLFGGIFRFDLDRPDLPNNDRLIFSKGHASPLFYALYAAAGRLSENDIKTLRRFGSSLEGHLTKAFPYTEVATGSLGQGLSIGLGIALSAKYLDRLSFKTYVLLGDSEMSEGSQWESIQLAAYYELNNLIGIIDVNRLGQRGETMYGRDVEAYRRRIGAFGWETIVIDGHSLAEVIAAYKQANQVKDRPVMIIAKTVKGKGVSFLEDREGWHGKALNTDQLAEALRELGEIDLLVRGRTAIPEDLRPQILTPSELSPINYQPGREIATRKAYGQALTRIYSQYPDIVVLDAEVSNSTFTSTFQEKYPGRFFEMFIAEQNMVGAALGLASRGKIPFVSTFAAFFTRSFDQIRMGQYSLANIKFAGSHAGVSIGEDGPSQMGLEDIALFRTLFNCAVIYPADAIATEKLVEEAARFPGMVYMRLTRNETPVIYQMAEEFIIGGSKVLKSDRDDLITIVAAGVTLFEALAAYESLKREGIFIRVIDLYSLKPVDEKTLKKAAQETRAVITVEDHFAAGGLGEAVLSALATEAAAVHILAVRKMPKSGKSSELLDFEGISQRAIIAKVKEVIQTTC